MVKALTRPEQSDANSEQRNSQRSAQPKTSRQRLSRPGVGACAGSVALAAGAPSEAATVIRHNTNDALQTYDRWRISAERDKAARVKMFGEKSAEVHVRGSFLRNTLLLLAILALAWTPLGSGEWLGAREHAAQRDGLWALSEVLPDRYSITTSSKAAELSREAFGAVVAFTDGAGDDLQVPSIGSPIVAKTLAQVTALPERLLLTARRSAYSSRAPPRA